jgi:hypothetical protein
MIFKYKDYIGLSVLLICILLIIFYYFCRTDSDNISSVGQTVTIDTVFIVKPAEPIVVEKVRTKIVYTKDTLIVTKPFIASFDTIIRHDTIRMSYSYPENSMSLFLNPKPDTSSIRYITIFKEITKEKPEPWWKSPLMFAAGAVSGVLAARIIRN